MWMQFMWMHTGLVAEILSCTGCDIFSKNSKHETFIYSSKIVFKNILFPNFLTESQRVKTKPYIKAYKTTFS